MILLFRALLGAHVWLGNKRARPMFVLYGVFRRRTCSARATKITCEGEKEENLPVGPFLDAKLPASAFHGGCRNAQSCRGFVEG